MRAHSLQEDAVHLPSGPGLSRMPDRSSIGEQLPRAGVSPSLDSEERVSGSCTQCAPRDPGTHDTGYGWQRAGRAAHRKHASLRAHDGDVAQGEQVEGFVELGGELRLWQWLCAEPGPLDESAGVRDREEIGEREASGIRPHGGHQTRLASREWQRALAVQLHACKALVQHGWLSYRPSIDHPARGHCARVRGQSNAAGHGLQALHGGCQMHGDVRRGRDAGQGVGVKVRAANVLVAHPPHRPGRAATVSPRKRPRWPRCRHEPREAVIVRPPETPASVIDVVRARLKRHHPQRRARISEPGREGETGASRTKDDKIDVDIEGHDLDSNPAWCELHDRHRVP